MAHFSRGEGGKHCFYPHPFQQSLNVVWDGAIIRWKCLSILSQSPPHRAEAMQKEACVSITIREMENRRVLCSVLCTGPCTRMVRYKFNRKDGDDSIYIYFSWVEIQSNVIASIKNIHRKTQTKITSDTSKAHNQHNTKQTPCTSKITSSWLST